MVMDVVLGLSIYFGDVLLAVEHGELLSADPSPIKRTSHCRTARYRRLHAGRLSNLAFRHNAHPQMTYAAQIKVIEETLMKLRLIE